MITDDQIKMILQRLNAAKLIRRWWETNLWNPVVELLMPQMGPMLSGTFSNPGEKRGSKAYDGSPEWAQDVLVSGMHSGLTPDNFKWFKWKLRPRWLNDENAVKRWLEECEDIAIEFIQGSNYHEETKQAYRQGSGLGTAIKWREKDPKKIFRFEVLKLTECCVVENRYGQVDTFFRECKWTARNAYKEWGDKCSDDIKGAINSGNYEQEFDFVYAVIPRDDFGLVRDTKLRDNKNMPWGAFWINPNGNKVMSEEGFRLFPASVWRWEKTPGDRSPYGRGPGIKALQDMGMLNAAAKMNAVAAESMVEPPLAIPDGFDKVLNLNPRGRNRYNQGESKGAIIQPIHTVTNLPYGVDTQTRMVNAVKSRFHVEAFLMLSDYQGSADRTVVEIMERKQEKLQILGPMLGTQKIEHLDADLDDIFRMLDEAGQFPPPPDIVLQYGSQIATEYESPLLTALKKNEASAVTQVYQVAGLISQAKQDPSVFDNLDDDYAIRLFSERTGAPMKLLKDEKARDAIRAARAKAAQEQAAMAQGSAAVEAAKNLGQVSTSPEDPNLLTDMAKGVAGMTQQ